MATELTLRRTLPIPAALAVAVVALQIAYPLTAGVTRDRLTVVTVLVFAATAVAHAAVTRGGATAVRLLLVTAVPGFAVEVLGVRTGFPFGDYAYSHRLGPMLLDTPVVVAFAWTMLAWPAALAAHRLARGVVARVLIGAWALAACDLFLDPQLVAAGGWRWAHPSPHLPGVPDVPLTNYAGWLAVALVMSSLVQRVAGATDADDRVPVALYLWLFAGWVLALGAFLDLRGAAAWGAVGMGAVAVPLARRLVR
ncbi:MAG TPA: carotenoid biosynthesis protein [Jatrophihabitans sp.]|jgi:putative membrane protein|uniref:carotenoid biosynthesis protein n=1 Tax=Jatrophihabitans sp. TaxID=1932789 RepID=UPI002E0746B3|nr:carotenoid biosynthesis protein [Jatrophihabitans sp.]